MTLQYIGGGIVDSAVAAKESKLVGSMKICKRLTPKFLNIRIN